MFISETMEPWLEGAEAEGVSHEKCLGTGKLQGRRCARGGSWLLSTLALFAVIQSWEVRSSTS